MARIRYVKPDFFSDTDAADVCRDARLFYIGLWCQLDKQGICEDNVRLLKRDIFPYDDDMTAAKIEELVQELVDGHFLVRIERAGVKYLWCPTFWKHQKFHPGEEKKHFFPVETLLATYQQVFGRLPEDVLPPSDRIGIGTGIGTGTGTGMGTGTGTAPADVQGACEAEWLETCESFGIPPRMTGCTPLEKNVIADAISKHGYAGVRMALFGVRFEKGSKSTGFNPKDHVNIARVFDPELINKFQMLGAKHKPPQNSPSGVPP